MLDTPDMLSGAPDNRTSKPANLPDLNGWPSNYQSRQVGHSAPKAEITAVEVYRKLSMRTQKLAKFPEDEFAWQLSGWRKSASELRGDANP